MSRNANSRFAMNPTNIDIPRSTFGRNCGLKTTMNVGQLIPIYVDEVLPGDTFKVKSNKVVRLQTLLTPMMDNLYLDTYFFFVPNRLVWEHWKQFNGENTESAWIPTTEYEVPQITSPSDTGFSEGTLADYFGLPVGVPNLSVSALPFRAYATIVNEWFRDQNLQDPVLIPVDDATVEGVNTDNYITDLAKGGMPFVAGKFRDYFTSTLPSPQRGPDVMIPVASAGDLPVVTSSDVHDAGIYGLFGQAYPYSGSGGSVSESSGSLRVFNPYSANVHYNFNEHEEPVNYSSDNGFSPTNLWAVNTGEAQAATINQLRLAFQIQKLYEKDARGGK